jgi:zinc transporter, ZIP family
LSVPTTYIAILLLASFSVLTTLIGVALAIYAGKSERAVAAGIGFSAALIAPGRCGEGSLP